MLIIGDKKILCHRRTNQKNESEVNLTVFLCEAKQVEESEHFKLDDEKAESTSQLFRTT
jgi:hypothetical protein